MTLGFPAAAALSPAEMAGQLICVALRDYRGDSAARDAFLESLERREMLSITPLQTIDSSGDTGEKRRFTVGRPLDGTVVRVLETDGTELPVARSRQRAVEDWLVPPGSGHRSSGASP